MAIVALIGIRSKLRLETALARKSLRCRQGAAVVWWIGANASYECFKHPNPNGATSVFHGELYAQMARPPWTSPVAAPEEGL